MDATSIKRQIVSALSNAVEPLDWVDSATVTGSFLTGADLAGISDIDFVVVVERLCGRRFEELQEACRAALAPVVRSAGYRLRINPTLGPLKFNDAETAVLHLMIYSRAGHVDHVVNSPFTCFDWQRSQTWFKRPLADVSAVFGLQPRHFLSARRSVSDYLSDYRAGRVSYREMECSDTECREVRRELPMQIRDRVEFAWHIVRFLMQNLLKLICRRNEAAEGRALCQAYLAEFGEDANDVARLFDELAAAKKSQAFATAPTNLDERLERFVLSFERQFRRAFVDEATRHVVIRHAPTAWNTGAGEQRRFLGRTDVPIEPLAEETLAPLVNSLRGTELRAAFTSPLARCRQTLAELARRIELPSPKSDVRLLEIDYGDCEGLTVAEARRRHPNLFASWQLGEDTPFPAGEGTAAVRRRVLTFAASRWNADYASRENAATLTCTHNVPLRILVGQTLSVPAHLWHRLSIEHLCPYGFVQTRRYGLFADLDEATYRSTFAGLVMQNTNSAQAHREKAA
jgi:broad specificity phosphatase PhoE